MLRKESISIKELDDKKFQNKLTAPLKEGSAIVTHYLHNRNNGIYNFFEKDALNIVSKYIEYKIDIFPSIVAESALQKFIFEVEDVPFPTPKNHKFEFVDLFAGIGGFRIALQNLGGKCSWTSEWDEYAKKTYFANFGQVPFGDITLKFVKNHIPPKKIDILCAGFPCQAFSIAGYQKGFSDTRGTLSFDIEQVIETHRPKIVFLENVKNLVTHDKGRTFKVILEILEKKLEYKVFYKVLNSMTHANVPQNRERIFIVAFDPKQVKGYNNFRFPEQIPLTKTIHDIIDNKKQDDKYYYPESHRYHPILSKEIVKRDTIYQWRRVYVRENKSNVCPTLTANMGAGGHNVPLIKDDFGIRKLTPKECFAFQGYPMDKYILPPIANSKLYMQAGNSVTTPLIERISNEIIKVL